LLTAALLTTLLLLAGLLVRILILIHFTFSNVGSKRNSHTRPMTRSNAQRAVLFHCANVSRSKPNVSGTRCHRMCSLHK
jgi:hypothetical protein